MFKKLLLIACVTVLIVGCNNDDGGTPQVTQNVKDVPTIEEDREPDEPIQNPGETETEEQLRDERFRQVTIEYGDLTVKEGITKGESDIVPWSSWWFPIKEQFMFEPQNNDLSPLGKYDVYVKERYDEYSEARYFEQKFLYDPAQVSWAGLCHAWAIASIVAPEPDTPRTMSGVRFDVDDQKAILLKTFENPIDVQYFGDRFDGQFDDEYEDIYPEQFHKMVQKHLFDMKKPFVMDYDASYPVWTVPVYKVRFDIKREAEDSVRVGAWITMASPHVDSPSYVGTRSVMKAYKYRLLGKWVGDEFHVNGGEWLEDSIIDHPDYLMAYPENVKRLSLNDEINIEYVDEILGMRGQLPEPAVIETEEEE